MFNIMVEYITVYIYISTIIQIYIGIDIKAAIQYILAGSNLINSHKLNYIYLEPAALKPAQNLCYHHRNVSGKVYVINLSCQ